MIRITKKEKCCGCRACRQICPVHCIEMLPDDEGFLYPFADKKRCTHCGLCDKVCPVLKPVTERAPLQFRAARNIDETTRAKSSSGGVFSLLAEMTLGDGGEVFGARFDEHWNVVHDSTTSLEGLAPFRVSKYVQSDTLDTFNRAGDALKQGRKVLYSGTPCQIAGLRNFLNINKAGGTDKTGKNKGKSNAPVPIENLLLVDVACHGVPNSLLWQHWLEERLGNRKDEIGSISFRSKEVGWEKFRILISDKNGSKMLDDPLIAKGYMSDFLHNINLRPSCHKCPAKPFRSGSDLTIADFWGVENFYPDFNDDRGASLVAISSERGREAFARIAHAVESFEVSFHEATCHNPLVVHSVKANEHRKEYFARFRAELETRTRIAAETEAGRSDPKKVGVITFSHSLDNYGQILQAFALQRVLLGGGYDPFLIRYDFFTEPEWVRAGLNESKKKRRDKNLRKLDPLYLVRHIWDKHRLRKERLVEHVEIRRKIDARRNAMLSRRFGDFIEQNITSTDIYDYGRLHATPPAAASYICGSDQIWNPAYTRIDKSYWLGFAPIGSRKIAYAASFGNPSFDEKQRARVGELLTSFDLVTLREENATEFCRALGRTDTETVLDPTLLVDASEYLERAVTPARKQKYLLLYLLGNNTDPYLESVYAFAAEKGLEVVYTYANVVSDAVCRPKTEATIPEWLGLISHAEYVITNSFHGTVFSILFGRQFLVADVSGVAGNMNNRVATLLATVGLNDRALNSDDIYKIDAPIDYAPVAAIIERERKCSKKLLFDALPKID